MNAADNQCVKVLLIEREIKRLIYTYCRAIDRCDRELLASIYHDDALEEHGSYNGNLPGFIDFAMATVEWMKDGGSHQITNILMEIEGDIVTSESAFFAIAAGASDPDGHKVDLLITGRYLDRFERRNDVWKVAHRQVVFDTNHTLKASGRWEGLLYGDFKPKGRPDRHDLLYTGVASPGVK